MYTYVCINNYYINGPFSKLAIFYSFIRYVHVKLFYVNEIYKLTHWTNVSLYYYIHYNYYLKQAQNRDPKYGTLFEITPTRSCT